MSDILEITKPLINLLRTRNRHFKLKRVDENTRFSFVEVVFSDTGPSEGVSLFPTLMQELMAIPKFHHVRVVSKDEIFFRLYTD